MIKVQRYTGTGPKISQRWKLFGQGTEVESSNCVKERFIWDQVQRYKGTELEVSSNFSDLQGDKLIMGRLKMNVT